MMILIICLACEENNYFNNEAKEGLPLITLVSPMAGDTIHEFHKITATASDDKGVTRVEFIIDNRGYLTLFDNNNYYLIWDAASQPHGSLHKLYAVAYDTDRNRSSTNIITFHTDSTKTPPKKVILNPPNEITDSSVRLTWSKNHEIDFKSYEIYYDTTATGNTTLFYQSLHTSDDTTEVINLNDNFNYRFMIKTVDQYLLKTNSNIVEASLANQTPPKPILYSVSNFNDTIFFKWSIDNIWDFDNYKLIHSSDSIYDATDTEIITFTDQSVSSYEYYSTEQPNGFYFIVVTDQGSLSSVSDPYLRPNQITNYALKFDGSQAATIPYFPELELGISYTLELWAYQTDIGYGTYLLNKVGDRARYNYTIVSDPYIGTGTCLNRVRSDVALNQNEWHHIAITYDNDTLLFYIDGLIVDTLLTDSAITCDYESNFTIGKNEVLSRYGFEGMLDEIRLWNVARTPEQILSTYNVHLIGNENGLVSYFDFDEGHDNIINSPVGNNGYLGDFEGGDQYDPKWVESEAPIIY